MVVSSFRALCLPPPPLVGTFARLARLEPRAGRALARAARSPLLFFSLSPSMTGALRAALAPSLRAVRALPTVSRARWTSPPACRAMSEEASAHRAAAAG